MIDIQKIGAEVRKERRLKDITQKQLAERSGVSLTAVIRLEKGADRFEINKLMKIVEGVGLVFLTQIRNNMTCTI